MLISAFCAIFGQFFSNFFLNIERFSQMLSTCHALDQLDHSNKNYWRGAESASPPPPLPRHAICKKPSLFKVNALFASLDQLPSSGLYLLGFHLKKTKPLENIEVKLFHTDEPTIGLFGKENWKNETKIQLAERAITDWNIIFEKDHTHKQKQ